jgi:hypothetical protein
MKKALSIVVIVLLVSATGSAQTVVKGHSRKMDANGNGYPDVGVEVNGHYTSLYAYDASGNWYWDLGDGRVQGTVGDPTELDAATQTSCDYVITFRATFDDDPGMDSGWIQNHIVCSGADRGVYQYLIVHKTDPRYTGNPAWAEWGGDWEYHVLVEWGSGNLVRRIPQL